MTDKRTITESEVPSFAAEFGVSEGLVRLGLHSLGWLIVPDPAPPLPTEPGNYRDKHGDAVTLPSVPNAGWYYGAKRLEHPERLLPFTRLETQAEGDTRVLATLRTSNRRALDEFILGEVERVLRDAREDH